MRGSKTNPETVELAMAQCAMTGSVTKAAQAAGLPVQTASDVVSRGPRSLELHKAHMEAYVASAWITAGRVDTELRRALDDPEWVEKCSPEGLAIRHNSLVRTVALVGGALSRVSSITVEDLQEVDSFEDIKSSAMQFVGDQFGLTVEDMDFALAEFLKSHI